MCITGYRYNIHAYESLKVYQNCSRGIYGEPFRIMGTRRIEIPIEKGSVEKNKFLLDQCLFSTNLSRR